MIQQSVDAKFEPIDAKIKEVEQKYIAIIDAMNESWANKFKLLTGSTTSARTTPSSPTSSKVTRTEPGSGSNRAKKLSKPNPPNLSSVQTTLIQAFNKQSDESNDATMTHE